MSSWPGLQLVAPLALGRLESKFRVPPLARQASALTNKSLGTDQQKHARSTPTLHAHLPTPLRCRVFGNAPGCPACCFLKGTTGWSRRSAPTLTAGTVPSRGSAPAGTRPAGPAPSQLPPAAGPASTAPAPATAAPVPALLSTGGGGGGGTSSSAGGGGGGGGGGGSSTQPCTVMGNTNLQGDVVATQQSVPDAGTCCSLW